MLSGYRSRIAPRSRRAAGVEYVASSRSSSLRRLRAYDSAWLAVMNQFVTALALAPLAWQHGVWPSPTQLVLLALFGAVQLGLPYFLFALAVKDIPGHEASVIGLLEPMLLPLWIYLAWGEPPDRVTYLGGGWIMLGLLLRYIPASGFKRS